MSTPPDRHIDIDDRRIHYLESGDAGAQPLLLLHGIARCAHAFDHLAPHFAKRYRVLSIDLRGHGDSGWESTIVPPHTQDELKAALPQAQIVTMPGLGHYPSDEDPEGFLKIVDGFLAKV